MENIFEVVRETESVMKYLFKMREFEHKSLNETFYHPIVEGAKLSMLATYRGKMHPARFVENALKAAIIMAVYKFVDDDDDLIEKGDYVVYIEEVLSMTNKGSAGSESYFGGSGRGTSNE